MSFRNRLILFFVLIVVVPMIVVGYVLFDLIEGSESGKADAALGAQARTAINLHQQIERRAESAAIEVGKDPELADALRSNDRAALRVRAEQLLDIESATRIVIADGEDVLVDVGDPDAVFPGSVELVGDQEQSVGRLELGVTTPNAYLAQVRRLTGADGAMRRIGGPLLASTVTGVEARDLPEQEGTISAGDSDYRANSFEADDFLGARARVSTLAASEELSDDVQKRRLLAAALIAGFFVLAITFALVVSRSLRGQINSFLQAARRLGGGDFTAQVPTVGHDEFAALGEEFNKMSRQLEQRVDELAEERARLQMSMRRIGETFASNLDREGLLEIVVKTAVEGLGADAGRASVRPTLTGPLQEVALTGSVEGVEEAVAAAEAKVLETGEPSEASVDGVAALSHPLRRDEHQARVSGVVTVARRDRAFTANERELFHYLAGQAAVSIENVGLHETVERQAVTDELTGLFNRRRFDEAMALEVERSRRFGQPLGLVLLDLDDFKQVNDTFGHQQGDLVLREVARVLRETSREIDEPARYGGEELAVVLPGTDLDGAYYLAERVRQGIEALELPLLDGRGRLQVTASFGVATLPGSADDLRGLIAAADEALYRAKRRGKNQTVRAEPTPRLG